MNDKQKIFSDLASNALRHIGNDPIWPISRLHLRRNLNRFPFPVKMSPNEAGQALELITAQFMQAQPDSWHNVRENELAPHEKELLYEHFLFFEDFPQKQSHGALFFNNQFQILATINLKNHFEYTVLVPKNGLEPALKALLKFDETLSAPLQWAFSPRFGYLVQDPYQAGTGLSAYAYLHLPLLLHFKKLAEFDQEEELLLTSLTGNFQDPVGHWIIAQNRFTLGCNEETIIQTILTQAAKLKSMEQKLRDQIKHQGDPIIKDFISKSFGVLLHGYQLEAKEALTHLSWLQLGLQLDWLSGISLEKLQALFFEIQRGHLSTLMSTTIEPASLPHQRASFIHQKLQGLELKI